MGAAPGEVDGRPRLGPVFVASVAISVAFVAYGVVAPGSFTRTLEAVRGVVVGYAGPVYPLTVLLVLAFVVGIALAPVGRLRLGPADSRPEFGFVSWVSMLLSAGVGLSFLFWGTAEPLIHLAAPPHGLAEPGSEEAARLGMRYSFLFWGVHAWALYALVALAVAYSSFRHGRAMLVSAALRPLLGARVEGVLGTVIDVLAVLAILFGVATSLGLGTRELNAGLEHLFGVPDSYGTKVAVIVCLMTVSTVSAMTGLGRGIRVLSLANVALAALLLVLVLLLGPASAVLTTWRAGMGDYVASFWPMTLATEGPSQSPWRPGWVFFFWAWWIAWAPFVGTFIARISRGRTVRGVVLGVVGVPGAVSMVWFSVLGGTALQRERSGAVEVADVAARAKSVATLEVLGSLPATGLLVAILVPVLALLFITSADSASFMLGSTTSGGSLKPPRPLRLMWSFAAAFAAVLLLTGGPDSLRGAALVAAAPFTLVLLGLGLSLAADLWRDRADYRAELAEPRAGAGGLAVPRSLGRVVRRQGRR